MRSALQNSASRKLSLGIAIALFTLVTGAPAQAGFFDFLFGRANAPPASQPQQNVPQGFPFPGQSQGETPQAQSGGNGRYTTYCVRLCDGRYFPVQANSKAGAAQMCQAFCPASATRLYSGNNIAGARAADGQSYDNLDNAFAFRDKLIANCTCNGRDALGLAPVDINMDTTLRSGDIVAGQNGLYAYQNRNDGGAFTPIQNYPGLSAETRAKLGEVKVAPGAAQASIESDQDVAEDTTSMPSDITGTIKPVAAKDVHLR